MHDDLKEQVRRKYGQAVERAVASASGLPLADETDADCCAPSCCGAGGTDPITRDLYDDATASTLPQNAVAASLGCGNPTALAELVEGEVVLDLGSGGGIDVLLSARRVGPTGKAYGLDMTDAMLAVARNNAAEAGATNVEFLKGEIEQIPLPDNSVDVIISNCVINLSGDKRQVLREAFRVLKPGGRFAVSDVVVRGAIPDEIRRSLELWVGCVAGALDEQEFLDLLTESGFEQPSIEPTRIYDPEDARAVLESAGIDPTDVVERVKGRILAAFVRARKPGAPDPVAPAPGAPAPSLTEPTAGSAEGPSA